MEPDQPKGIFLKGERRPMMLSSGLKGQFTVVGCVSAAGFCLPPFVIIDRKRFNPAFAEGEVPGHMVCHIMDGSGTVSPMV